MPHSYSTEQWLFEISNLNSAEFNFVIRQRIITQSTTQILREIENLPELFWNVGEDVLHQQRNFCLENIEKAVRNLSDAWHGLRFAIINRQEAQNIFESSMRMLNHNFDNFNRLLLVQLCLIPQRRFIAQRHG